METAKGDVGLCARCGSHHLLPDLAVQAGGSKIRCEAGAQMFGFVTLSVVMEEVTATVCVDCGHTELRVKDTSGLRRVYDQQR